jgi:hypothetical protein
MTETDIIEQIVDKIDYNELKNIYIGLSESKIKNKLKPFINNIKLNNQTLLNEILSNLSSDLSRDELEKYTTLLQNLNKTYSQLLFELYKYNFNNVKNIRNRIDYGSLINQIYLNNDQVQYFNNAMSKINNNEIHPNLHVTVGSPYAQHAFRVFGVNKNNSNTYRQVIKTPELRKFMELTSTKPFYYCGIQISADVNNLWRKYNQNKIVQKFIIFHLFILGYLFTHKLYYLNDNKRFITELKEIWDRTYGAEKPSTFEEQVQNPIQGLQPPIFPITLKYKENVIEDYINKTIFNMGDSGATVNFFSGTGLNTGVSNIKNILENYKTDKTNTTDLNEMIRKKNRRTIYNSLSSSQNPSVLSGIRNFQYPGPPPQKLGFFKNNTNNDLITEKVNILNNDNENEWIDKDQIRHINNIKKYYDNFDTIFDITFPRFFPEPSALTIQQKDEIKNILKVNVGYCLINIISTPIIGETLDYEKESLTYAHHLHYNHFDTCNFMTGNDRHNNKPYYCDLLGDKPDFDSRRMTQINRSSIYTT